MTRRTARRSADLQASFWFYALLVALTGPVLAGADIVVDHAAGRAGVLSGLVISPTSARAILDSIAGSLITIASLTASLTIVTLQLLSSQYTPRAIRQFLRTRLSQVVLGTFIGVFLYCIVLALSVRAPGEENRPFVPSLGVVIGVVLAVGALCLLVVFIHRFTGTIQISSMVSRVARDTRAAIVSEHPQAWNGESAPVADRPLAGRPIEPDGSGYVREIALDLLLETARRADVRIEVVVCAGEFVTPADALVVVEGEPGDASRLHDDVRRAIAVGPERDIDCDPGFGIRVLVDIALRACSPGINDPSTAVTCINYMRGLLEELSGRELPAAIVLGDRGQLRARRWTFEHFVAPMSEIVRYAASDPRVVLTLAGALTAAASVADSAGAATRARDLRGLADDLIAPAREQASTAHDRRLLESPAPRATGV